MASDIPGRLKGANPESMTMKGSDGTPAVKWAHSVGMDSRFGPSGRSGITGMVC
jgi:hypothetical protein